MDYWNIYLKLKVKHLWRGDHSTISLGKNLHSSLLCQLLHFLIYLSNLFLAKEFDTTTTTIIVIIEGVWLNFIQVFVYYFKFIEIERLIKSFIYCCCSIDYFKFSLLIRLSIHWAEVAAIPCWDWEWCISSNAFLIS